MTVYVRTVCTVNCLKLTYRLSVHRHRQIPVEMPTLHTVPRKFTMLLHVTNLAQFFDRSDQPVAEQHAQTCIFDDSFELLVAEFRKILQKNVAKQNR